MNQDNYSKQIFERFERYQLWRRIVATTYLTSYLLYLGWRLTIFAPNSMILSSLYFFAEVIGFILALLIVTTSWKYSHRNPIKAPKNLSVDVFIPTYKEPLEIIRKTLQAAKAIDYPHQTWVLDDGKRTEVRAIADELGLNYLSRPENTHAKAGNMNYGLKHSKAEFIMVFDADHIALPHALDITLGFFTNHKIAMVQTPQDYYNTDAFQYINSKKTRKIWHDQSFFYNIFQSCQDSFDNSSCVGTGAVYRREVLDEIGGFPTKTVTEDIHTSLKMTKLGYKTLYLNEAIAYGVASSDLTEYYKTRHRWAQGNIHALVDENIAFCKGLSFKQRISHLSLGLICLEGWQQILLFLIPVTTLIFGLPPFEISILNILIVLSFPFFSYLMLQEIGCGFSRFWTNELFAMIRWPMHIISASGLFGKKIAWISSAKNIKSAVNWQFMMPQLTVLAVSVLALTVSFFRLKDNFEVGPFFLFLRSILLNIPFEFDLHATMTEGYTFDLVLIAGAWVFYNIIRVLFFVHKVFQNVKNTNEFFQFEVPLPILINNASYGNTTKISEEIIKYQIQSDKATDYTVGDLKEISLYLTPELLDLKTRIISLSYCRHKKTFLVEAKILWQSELDRKTLCDCIYSINWHRHLFNNDKDNYFLTPLEFVLKILSFEFLRHTAINDWQPILYKESAAITDAKSQKCAFLSSVKNNNDSIELTTFEELAIGTTFDGFTTKDPLQAIKLTILRSAAVAEIPRKCLNGSILRTYEVTAL